MSGVPNFYAVRLSLTTVADSFAALMLSYKCVDVHETIRLMLADYFYSDYAPAQSQCLESGVHRLVLNPSMYPDKEDIPGMFECLSDIYWNMADIIQVNALTLFKESNNISQYNTTDCFYTYSSMDHDLMIYMPVRPGDPVVMDIAQIDGRAVIATCRSTWPQFYRDSITQPPAGANF